VILIDTNLWLYASLRETPHHSAAKALDLVEGWHGGQSHQ
jgi:predicted nucleic acid-binding protein